MKPDDMIEVMDLFLHGEKPVVFIQDIPGVVVDIHSRPDGKTEAPFLFDVKLVSGETITIKGSNKELYREEYE